MVCKIFKTKDMIERHVFINNLTNWKVKQKQLFRIILATTLFNVYTLFESLALIIDKWEQPF